MALESNLRACNFVREKKKFFLGVCVCVCGGGGGGGGGIRPPWLLRSCSHVPSQSQVSSTAYVTLLEVLQPLYFVTRKLASFPGLSTVQSLMLAK